MAVSPVGLPIDYLTLEKIDAQGVDSIHTRSSLLSQVLANAEDFNGRHLNWHVVTATNDTVTAFTAFDTLNINPQQPLTQATLYFTNIAASVILADDQVAVNATEAGKVDYVKAMSEHAYNTVGMKMGSALYSDGVSNVIGAKDPVGLAAAINNTTGDNLDVNGAATAVTRPAIANYAGISRATFPAWSSVVRNANGPLTLDTVYKMKALIEKQSKGQKVETIVVGPTTWTYFAKLTTAVQRINSNPSGKNPMLSAGADNVMIAGLEVVSDVLCPEGIAYFLKKDGISYATLTPANNSPINYTITTTEDNNFKANPVKAFWRSSNPVRPTNQNATVYHVGTTGNFKVKNPACHGCLTNITA